MDELVALGQYFGSMLAIIVGTVLVVAAREYRRHRPPRPPRTPRKLLRDLAEIERLTEPLAGAREWLTAPTDAPETTPIWDELEAEWPTLYRARRAALNRALITPTQELRTFTALILATWTDDEVDRLADLAEPCTHCEPADIRTHAACPGCACPCTAVALELAHTR